jgi:hypothetical protein
MSYAELTWFIGLVITFIFSLYLVGCCEDGFPLVISLLYLVILGWLPWLISTEITEEKITSKQEITPKLINLDDKRLNIITDNYSHYSFDTFENINKWKNGGKFYYVTTYKKCFGPDENQATVVIE